jgi:hypothetical protein
VDGGTVGAEQGEPLSDGFEGIGGCAGGSIIPAILRFKVA